MHVSISLKRFCFDSFFVAEGWGLNAFWNYGSWNCVWIPVKWPESFELLTQFSSFPKLRPNVSRISTFVWHRRPKKSETTTSSETKQLKKLWQRRYTHKSFMLFWYMTKAHKSIKGSREKCNWRLHSFLRANWSSFWLLNLRVAFSNCSEQMLILGVETGFASWILGARKELILVIHASQARN